MTVDSPKCGSLRMGMRGSGPSVAEWFQRNLCADACGRSGALALKAAGDGNSADTEWEDVMVSPPKPLAGFVPPPSPAPAPQPGLWR